jgi:predicted permease
MTVVSQVTHCDGTLHGITAKIALGDGMRHRNWRLVMVGMVMLAAAAAFFLGMQTTAPKSTDPVALMRIVGQVSGVVGALGLVMLGYGLVGRKA